MRQLLAIACLGATLLSEAALAQPPERPAVAVHRFDEDWREWCRTAEPQGFSRLKCIELGDGTLTLGGELRERLEAVRNPDFGLDQDEDSVLLHRAILHADLRVGESVRTFVQLGYFDQSGRNSGPTPTDVDRLDVTQAFVDLSAPLGNGRATLRGGRQEVSFGSQRLIATREGPNIRRSYDGGRAFWTGGGYRLDALYVQPVEIERGSFDDGTSDDEALWGGYLTGPVPGSGRLKADLYYLGYRRDDARFAAGVADERRYSLGLRLFGESEGFDWDFEGVYQFGRFGNADLQAWTIASDVGLTFEAAPMRPRLGLKANIASGDRTDDRRLGTFNALYPKLPYFSEAGLIAPANLMDLQPLLEMQATSRLTIELGWNALWRHRLADAVYTAPLIPVPGTAGRPGRYTGHQSILGFSWRPKSQVSVSGQYVHFEIGDAIRRAGGRNVDFLTLSAAFRF